jgi:hypothetical protein
MLSRDEIRASLPIACKILLLAHSVISPRCKICPLLDNSGQRWILARDGLSAFDPTATLAVHCGNDFYTGFSPY